MAEQSPLSEEQRAKLDGIVAKMVQNGEKDEDIQFVVNDFKSKYSKKKDSTESESTGETEVEASDSTPNEADSLQKAPKFKLPPTLAADMAAKGAIDRAAEKGLDKSPRLEYERVDTSDKKKELYQDAEGNMVEAREDIVNRKKAQEKKEQELSDMGYFDGIKDEIDPSKPVDEQATAAKKQVMEDYDLAMRGAKQLADTELGETLGIDTDAPDKLEEYNSRLRKAQQIITRLDDMVANGVNLGGAYHGYQKTEDLTEEQVNRFTQDAINEVAELLDVDPEGLDLDYLRQHVGNNKEMSEGLLFERTLERAAYKEAIEAKNGIEWQSGKDYTFTKTATKDAVLNIANQAVIMAADMATNLELGDFSVTAERYQQKISERSLRASIELGHDPNDSRGAFESLQDGDVGLGLEKLTMMAAQSWLPMATAILNPGAAVAYGGVSGTLGTYEAYRDRGDLTEEEKYTLAFGSGIAEGAITAIGMGNIRRARAAAGIADAAGTASAAARRQSYKKAIDFLKPYTDKVSKVLKTPSVRAASTFGRDVLEEQAEELSIAAVQQGLAYAIANDEFDPYEFADTFLSTLLISSPTSGLTAGREFQTYSTINAMPKVENLDAFEELTATYQDLKNTLKEGNLNKEERAIVKSEMKTVKAEISKLKLESIEAFDNMSEEDQAKLVAVNNQIRKLSNTAKNAESESVKQAAKRGLKRALEFKSELEGSVKSKVAEPTGATEIKAETTEENLPDVMEVAAKQDRDAAEAKRAEIEERGREKILAKNVKDNPVKYKNPVTGETVEGTLQKDGQSMVVETTDGQVFELGNFDELQNTPVEELGVEVEPLPDVSLDGNTVTVRGEKYVNSYEPSSGALNYNEEGEFVSVTLDTENGEKRTFRGDVGSEIAYQMWLQENASSPEAEQQIETELEQLIDEDEEARRILEQAPEPKAEPVEETKQSAPLTETEANKKTKRQTKRSGRVKARGNVNLDENTSNVVNRIASVLGLVSPDIEVVLHESRDTYDKTYDKASRSAAHYNPVSGKIHMLVDPNNPMNEEGLLTLKHEVVHPILDAILASDPVFAAKIENRIQSLMKRYADGTPEQQRVLAHWKRYDGRSDQPIELLTEFLAVFSEPKSIVRFTQDKTALQKLVDFLQDIVDRIQGYRGKDIPASKDAIIKLVADFNSAFQTGSAIKVEGTATKVQQDAIRESLSKVKSGKNPYEGAVQPKVGDTPQNVIEAWEKSNSNYIIAKDFAHSLELRRMGFVEAFERKDGSIVLAKPVSYESYDATTGVSRLSKKSFLSESDIEGKSAKTVAKTITSLGKLAGKKPKFVNRPDLPFTSSMIVPDKYNELSEPTVVVNLAYANERTGSSGYSYLILETLRANNPTVVNKLFQDISKGDSERASLYKNYLDYMNVYQGLSPNSESTLKDGDKELVAMARTFQEILDDAITSIDPSASAIDIQNELSKIINRSVDSDNSVVISSLPMGDGFVEAISAAFDANINPQESLVTEAEQSVKDKIVKKVLEKTSNKIEGSLNTLRAAADKMSTISANFGGNARTLLDIFQLGGISDQALNHFASNVQYLGITISKDVDFLKEIGNAYQSAFDLKNAIAKNPEKVKKQISEYIKSGFKGKRGDTLELFKSIYELSPKSFKESVYDGKEVDFKSLSIVLDKMLSGNLGTIIENITDDFKKIRSVADKIQMSDALYETLESTGNDVLDFMKNNESTSEVLRSIYTNAKEIDDKGDLKQSIEKVKTAREAFAESKGILGRLDKDGVFTKDFKNELKEYVKRVHGENIPKGSEYLFSSDADVALSVEAVPNDKGFLVVQYQFLVDGVADGYVEYPSNWNMARITMPLVFEWTNSIGAVLNSKGVTFKAVDSTKHPKIPKELYTKADIARFESREAKGVGNYKRRGLNNNAAFTRGHVNTNRTSRDVGFYFNDSFEVDGVPVTNEGYYVSRDISLLDLVNLNENEINLKNLNSIEIGKEVGRILRKNPEVLKKIVSNPKSLRLSDNIERGVESVNEASYTLPEAEYIPNNAPLRSLFNNSEKFVTNAAIRESLSKEDKTVGRKAAQAVDGMTQNAEDMILEKSKSKFTIKGLLGKQGREMFVDKSASLKAAMEKGFDSYVKAMFTNINGVRANADRIFQKIEKDVFGGLNSTEEVLLDKIVFLKRVIQIDTNWDTRLERNKRNLEVISSEIASLQDTLKRTNSKDKQTEIRNKIKDAKSKAKYFEKQVEKYSVRPKHPTDGSIEINLENAVAALQFYREQLGSEKMAKLEDRAKKFFDAYGEVLKISREAGLIDENTYNEFKGQDYSPRVFLKTMFEGVDDFTLKQMSLSDEQIKSIREGSELEIFTDIRYLLSTSIRAVKSKEAKNKLYSVMDKEAAKKEYKVKGDFIREANYSKDSDGNLIEDGFGNRVVKDPTKGFTNVVYWEDGKKRAFQISSDLYAQLTGTDDRGIFKSPAQKRWVRRITQSGTVKLFATGIKPAFAVIASIRGLQEVTRGRGVYDKYRFLPLMQVMAGVDMIKGIGQATLDTELVDDYFAHGGGMSFMTTQGKPSTIYKRKNSTVRRLFGKYNPVKTGINVLSYAGEKAELGMRLGIYSRSLKNIQEARPELTLDQQKALAVEEARLIADFSQGGWATKDLDAVKPYINAAVQGTRGTIDYAKKNPAKFVSKQAQAYMINMAITMFAKSMLDDEEWEKISPYARTRYNIIPIGIKNEEGQQITLRLPKAHQFMGIDHIASVSGEALLASLNGEEFDWKMYGKDEISGAYLTEDGIMMAEALLGSMPVGDLIPKEIFTPAKLSPANMFFQIASNVPTFGALDAYENNIDRYRESVITYDKGVVHPYMENYGNDRTRDIYKYFVNVHKDALGLAPANTISAPRLQAAVEKIITNESNAVVNLMYGLLDAVITTPEDKDLSVEKKVKKIAFDLGLTKALTYTIPKKKFDASRKEIMDNIDMEERSRRKVVKTKIKDFVAASDFKLGQDVPKELVSYLESLPISERKYGMDYAKNILKGMEVPPVYFDIKYSATPKAAANKMKLAFGFESWDDLDKDVRIDLITDLKSSGYKPSNEFYYHLK